jgi:hypothetical protein
MLRSCLSQAEDLFLLAESAAANTSALLYYYSMLNLAKALIYLEEPNALVTPKDFSHGLTDRSRIKTAEEFRVDDEELVVRHGIFKTLHRVLCGDDLAEGTRLSLRSLLRQCGWIGMEMSELGDPVRLALCWVESRVNAEADLVWAVVFMHNQQLTELCRSVEKFVADNSVVLREFERVASEIDTHCQFESKAVAFSNGDGYATVQAMLRSLRLHRQIKYSSLDAEPQYMISLSDCMEATLPEACGLLAICFYLSSVARYQPHVYEALRRSSDGWLFEAFLRQCPVVYASVMLMYMARAELMFI